MTPRALALSALALAAVLACREGSGGSAAPPGPRRYTVRGEVVTLPGAGPARQIAIRHEAIPDLVDRDGKVVGMGAMVMPFELAPGVSLDGIAEGDPVEMVLAVDWAAPSLRIEKLTELPAGTRLTFGK
jgi:hypothetical protein